MHSSPANPNGVSGESAWFTVTDFSHRIFKYLSDVFLLGERYSILTHFQVLIQQGQAQQMFFTKKQLLLRRAFKNGLLYPCFSRNKSRENTFHLGYHDSHKNQQAGNYTTSIQHCRQYPQAHNKHLTSGIHLLLCLYLPRPCSHKVQTLLHLLGQQGVTSAPLLHWQTNLERSCSLPGFSAKLHSYTRRGQYNPQTKIKKVQKLKIPLSQQLAPEFNNAVTL